VPDEVVIRLVERRIREQTDKNGLIFKGYPRTLVQAYILDGLLRKAGSSVSCILDIRVPPLELVKRLAGRGRTERAMPYDHSTDTIVQRLEEHELFAKDLSEYYEKTGRLSVVDGVGPHEAILDRLIAHVDTAFRQAR